MPTFIPSLPYSLKRTQIICGAEWEATWYYLYQRPSQGTRMFIFYLTGLLGTVISLIQRSKIDMEATLVWKAQLTHSNYL